jgi:hypothetical protein
MSLTGVEARSSDPVFPREAIHRGPYNSEIVREGTAGLTKRELIAAMALQGILAHSYNDASYDGAARDAVVHADHLLLELAKERS